MKKLLVLILTMATALSLVGCTEKVSDATTKENSTSATAAVSSTADATTANDSKDRPVVGVLFDFLQVERRVKSKEAIEMYAEQYGFDIVFQNANGDEKLQLQQCENLITQGVDIMIILPQNGDAAAPMVEQAQAAGIKVIVTDRIIANAEPEVFVGINNTSIGDIMAEYVFNLKPDGNYAMISGAPTDPNIKIFKDGWLRVVGGAIDSKSINLISDTTCENWDPTVALKNTENFLTANNDKVDVILAMNDGTAGGAIQALKARGLNGKVLVTGQDGELAACQRIVEGDQTMTVWKPDDKIAELLAKTVMDLYNGTLEATQTVNNGSKDIPAVLFEPIAVDKENMMETVIASGYHKMEDVYKNIPKDQWPS